MDVDDLPDEYWVLVIAGISSYVSKLVIDGIQQALEHPERGQPCFWFTDIFGILSGAPVDKVEHWYYSSPETRRLVNEFTKARNAEQPFE